MQCLCSKSKDKHARHARVFLVKKKPLEVVNLVLVSRCCHQSGQLKVIGQFSLNGIGCKTCVKFFIVHWSVLINLLYSHISYLEFHLSVSLSSWISQL